MEETLGKRVAAHRKRLGMTQDKLAEALGVTAQAVSKWENDQSCPDISTLPKLARVFGVTTDALLGLEQELQPAEVVMESDTSESKDPYTPNHNWEFQWYGGRKGRLGLALWVLLVGGLSLIGTFYTSPYGFPSLWTLSWTCGLLLFGLFGLFGLYPRFSVFRLGCALAGGYFLVNALQGIYTQWNFILSVILILLGMSLLFHALKHPDKGLFRITRCGRTVSSFNGCTQGNDSFSCTTCFGKNTYLISLPRLSCGEGCVSFGEMTVDLTGCETVAENCRVHLECAFGELVLLVPRRFRAELNHDTAFGSVDVQGSPDSGATVFTLDCEVSFGQITLRYI